MLDLVIRGGDVIDGSGKPRRVADVGVQDGRIVAIGSIEVEADRIIEAAGRVVAPGFIDVHTHFDAQVFWDGALTPSPFHGVTTVLAGNCGFSIAPLSEDASDRQYLMRMLSRVEGMPLESLDEGVPWDWRSTGEYLAAVEPLLGINAGFMVGHSAIRRQVMGRQAAERAATAAEIEAMTAKLREGLEAGGIGFSSSWARTHSDAEGNMVPSRHATREELLTLCGVAGEFDGTSLEFIPMVGRFEPWARELMADMSIAAGRTLNWNVLTIANLTAEDIDNRLQASDVARARGGKVIALTMPLSVGSRLNFASGFVLDAIPGWEDFMHSSASDRLAGLADPGTRAALGAAALSEKNPLRVPVNWDAHVILDVVAPENAQFLGLRLGDIAADQGRPAWDVLCDIVVADELATSFGTPTPDLSRDEWQRRIDVARDERTIIGASDAGAHVDLFGTFNYPTIMLAEAVRRHEILSLEEAVHHLTEAPARLYGIEGRGNLVEGAFADIVVFDPKTVASHGVAMRYDLPGGAGRLYAESDGIEHVIVNGVPVLSEGTLSGARAGSLLRGGRDTATAPLA